MLKEHKHMACMIICPLKDIRQSLPAARIKFTIALMARFRLDEARTCFPRSSLILRLVVVASMGSISFHRIEKNPGMLMTNAR